VVGDIPPLACAAAARAGVPSVALGNFTWDWVYSIYPAFDRFAADVIPAIRRAYATSTRALRLPLHGGFEPMAAVTRDIPFIARRSARDPADTRRQLGLAGDRPIVLPSFGGYGAGLPIEALRRSGSFTLIEPVREPPAGLLYQDLVAAADVVVSKPGYGIVSECVANGTALLYTSRGRFIEYDLFVEQMPRILRCRYISQEDLLAGHWADAVDALLAQPDPPDRPPVNGAAIAAEQIVNLAIG
jgi:L-arabinokinase